MKMKQCRKCNKEKPLEEFYRDKRLLDGRRSWCKACWYSYHHPYRLAWQKGNNRERARTYRRTHKNQINAQIRAWKQRTNTNGKDYQTTEALRAQAAVYRAIKRGDLIRQPCAICGDENVHAHHSSYEDPLKVDFLCPLHHKAHHMGEIEDFKQERRRSYGGS